MSTINYQWVYESSLIIVLGGFQYRMIHHKLWVQSLTSRASDWDIPLNSTWNLRKLLFQTQNWTASSYQCCDLHWSAFTILWIVLNSVKTICQQATITEHSVSLFTDFAEKINLLYKNVYLFATVISQGTRVCKQWGLPYKYDLQDTSGVTKHSSWLIVTEEYHILQ